MSNPKVKTPDTGYIATVTRNGYGDATVSDLKEVKCAFFQQYSHAVADNQEITQSDAYAYVDIDNAFVKGLGYQLQGMYFKIAPFGTDQWYIITTVQVAQRKLLTNEINNVMITLQIAAQPAGA